MAKKNAPVDSFTSMRILSAKAQSLWAKARERMHQNSSNSNAPLQDVSDPRPKQGLMHVDVSFGTVVKVTVSTILVVLLAYTLFSIRDKLFIIVLSAFIALVMDRHVRRLEAFRIPRGLAVISLYALFLSIAVFLLASLIPIVATQIQDLARFMNQQLNAFLSDPQLHFTFLSETMNASLSTSLQQGLESIGIRDRASALFQFGQNLATITPSFLAFAAQVAGSVFNFVVNASLILFLAFFIQLEREKIGEFLRIIIPRNYRNYYDAKAVAIHEKVSQWFHGQLILCVVIGSLVFIALTILKMPYALTLALLAGFTEFIPYAGPIIGALPAVFIAVTQSGPEWGLVVAMVYYAVQFCENNLLVPLIMKHAVGLSPIATMIGMLVGVSFPSTVHPVIGIILAVPVTAIITIFVQDFYMMQKRK